MLLTYVILYGLVALAREALAVWYYRAIFEKRAISASIANGLIELVDLTVLSSLVMLLTRTGTKMVLPAMTYVLCGSMGVYLAVRCRNK